MNAVLQPYERMSCEQLELPDTVGKNIVDGQHIAATYTVIGNLFQYSKERPRLWLVPPGLGFSRKQWTDFTGRVYGRGDYDRLYAERLFHRIYWTIAFHCSVDGVAGGHSSMSISDDSVTLAA